MLTLCNNDGRWRGVKTKQCGDRPAHGVAGRSSMARCMFCFSFLHFLMILMVSTCLPMNPLGNQGMRWCVGCPTCGQSPGTTVHGFLMYCDVLLLTILLGWPNNGTAFLFSSVTFSLVVASRGVTMGYFKK